MSDAEFDELEDRLRELDPDNDYFAIVGINTAGGNAVHEIPMLSMGKAKSMPELARGLNGWRFGKDSVFACSRKLTACRPAVVTNMAA
jgi:NAD-dependent DNA ligase